jgi:hypothetical protein
MSLRRLASLLVLLFLTLSLALGLSGCGSLKAIAITPAAGVEVLTAVGQTAQFTAVGQSQMGSATPTTSNITSQVTWSRTSRLRLQRAQAREAQSLLQSR